jgi:hypothetical protein
VSPVSVLVHPERDHHVNGVAVRPPRARPPRGTGRRQRSGSPATPEIKRACSRSSRHPEI